MRIGFRASLSLRTWTALPPSFITGSRHMKQPEPLPCAPQASGFVPLQFAIVISDEVNVCLILECKADLTKLWQRLPLERLGRRACFAQKVSRILRPPTSGEEC